MNTFKLLVAEDKEDELQACRDSAIRFQEEKKNYRVDITTCKTKEEAFKLLDNTFDGAIIDLKLQKAGTEGNDIVKYIQENHWRIPTAIFTGTPDNVDMEFSYVGIYKKGEISYYDLIDKFSKIYDTGLTRILGGRGQIEEILNKVFTLNILPKMHIWIQYSALSPEKIQKVLLRITLNHLMQILENNGELFFPEEVYIIPPLTSNIRTGSILKKKLAEEYRIVLNPACDLEIRSDGKPKTDRYLLGEIENELSISNVVTSGINVKDKKERRLIELLKNNHCDYYHWLPRTSDFLGGFINFRKILSYSADELNAQFESPKAEISQQFVKDIISRFSSYYGRQGQPDIDFSKKVTNLLSSLS